MQVFPFFPSLNQRKAVDNIQPHYSHGKNFGSECTVILALPTNPTKCYKGTILTTEHGLTS